MPFLEGSNGDSILATTSPRPATIVISDANGNVVDWIPQWVYIHATATLTTSSVSDVTITDMSFVPRSGTFEVEFNCNAGNSANGNATNFSLYLSGVQITNATRTVTTGANNRATVLISANITFDGSQLLEVKWNTPAGTASIQNRTLRYRRVGN